MAELATGPWLLAVEVDMRAGNARDVAAAAPSDQVDHCGRPDRSTRAAGRGSRAGGSRTGSSPRPRSSSDPCCGPGRELVRQQPAADLEQLEREHAHVAELVEEPRRVLLRLRLQRLAPVRARCGGFRPGGRSRRAGRTRLAVAAAHGEQRELAVERDTLLEDMSGVSPRPCLHQPLALAVVAEPPRLQERGERSTSSSIRAVGMPSRRKSCFSTSRSCDASSAAGAGRRHGRAASTGTFSNS